MCRNESELPLVFSLRPDQDRVKALVCRICGQFGNLVCVRCEQAFATEILSKDGQHPSTLPRAVPPPLASLHPPPRDQLISPHQQRAQLIDLCGELGDLIELLLCRCTAERGHLRLADLHVLHQAVDQVLEVRRVIERRVTR